MQSRTLRKYLGLSASVLLLAGNSAWAAQTLEYSIRWDTKDDRYHVFMKPTVTPSPRDMSLTGQITIRVPHATGADAFVVDDPKSVVANTSWSNNSRVDAPEEDTSVDYISFSLSVIQSSAFAWQAGEEKEVLNFRNSATCIGPVSLINNDTDPFNAPLLTGGQNSAHTNPGNQFTNLGWGGSTENNYLDNYGANSANCEDSLDSDGDGLKDGDENALGLDPLKADTDGDGVGDQAEVGANPASPTDTDADGTPDALDTDDDGDGKPSKDEGNDPNGDGSPADAVDTDGDSVPDYLDADNSDGPMADPDGDGLTNAEEVTNGTDPAKADTDGDGIPDGVEINTTHTDPTKADSDGDGLPDGAEVNTTHTDPVLADTDGDGLSDGVEVNTTHTDPVLADTDGDGLPDGVEVNSSKTDPLQPDSDGDGVGDQAEVGANPVSPTDTDADGTPDALDTDDDNDGVLTSNENYNGGNPAGDDTDGDQIPDYLDTDDDGDGKLSKDEGNDPNGDGSPADATDIDEDGIPDYLDTTINGIKLQLKLMLQGAYNSTTQLMQADLRGKGLIPQIQPYNRGLYQYEGTEATTSALLATTDNNAPVDWVLVELRDSTNPTTIKARLAALVQRDGDVMDAATGSTTLQVPKMVSGDYYVAIHHRNHLGVVTASAVSLNPSTATLVDFTKTSTAVWGSNARIMSGGNAMLWAGNANLDTRIIANGPSNDTGVIMGSLLMDPANLSVSSNYQLAGYQDTDINMDGLSIFAGPSNDVNLLLGNILLHPGNNTFSANYIISRQMP